MKIKNILFVSLFAGAVLSSCDYTDLSPRLYYRQDVLDDNQRFETFIPMVCGLLASPTATGWQYSDNFVPKDYSGYLFNEYTSTGLDIKTQ